MDPKEIDLILLTHGHWDHITCLTDIRAASGAKVAIHHRDQPFVETGKPPLPTGATAYGRAMSAIVGDMAMNDWYLRLTPGLPVLADDIHMLVESWKNILPMGIQTVYPAHGGEFPVSVMQKEIEAFK